MEAAGVKEEHLHCRSALVELANADREVLRAIPDALCGRGARGRLFGRASKSEMLVAASPIDAVFFRDWSVPDNLRIPATRKGPSGGVGLQAS